MQQLQLIIFLILIFSEYATYKIIFARFKFKMG